MSGADQPGATPDEPDATTGTAADGARRPARRPAAIEFASLVLIASGGFTVVQAIGYKLILGDALTTPTVILAATAILGFIVIVAGVLVRSGRAAPFASGAALAMALLYTPQVAERPAALVFVLVHLAAAGGIVRARGWIAQRPPAPTGQRAVPSETPAAPDEADA